MQYLLVPLIIGFIFQLNASSNLNVDDAIALIEQLPESWPLAPGNPLLDVPGETKEEVAGLTKVAVKLSAVDSEVLISAYRKMEQEILDGKRSPQVERKLLLLNKMLFDVPETVDEHSELYVPLRGTLRNGPNVINEGRVLIYGTWPWIFNNGEAAYSLERRLLFFQGRYDFVTAFVKLNENCGRRRLSTVVSVQRIVTADSTDDGAP